MTLENDLPTRAEIEAVLDRVSLPAGSTATAKAERNTYRRLAVQDLLDDLSLPPVEQQKLLDDLSSYPQWEVEVDDA